MADPSLQDAVDLLGAVATDSAFAQETGQAIDSHLRQAATLADAAGAQRVSLIVALARLETLRQFALPELQTAIETLKAKMNDTA
jgi:hypothetical protein